MVYIEKNTRQRYVRARHTGDIILDAQGPNPSLTQETVPVIGGWTDYTGSGGVPTKQQLYAAGLPDELFGTDSYLEGARKKQLGIIGEKVDKYRLRTKKIYVENPDKK